MRIKCKNYDFFMKEKQTMTQNQVHHNYKYEQASQEPKKLKRILLKRPASCGR